MFRKTEKTTKEAKSSSRMPTQKISIKFQQKSKTKQINLNQENSSNFLFGYQYICYAFTEKRILPKLLLLHITHLFTVSLEEQQEQQNLLRQPQRGEFEMDSTKLVEKQKWVSKI